MKRRRWVWAALAILLALAVGSYIYQASRGTEVGRAQASNPNETPIPQAVARRGDLAVFISGTGTLVPVSSSDLAFDQPGNLLEMNVSTGDRVQAGDILARLKIDKSLVEHQAELAGARLAVLQAQQNLDELVANAGLEAAQALNDLEIRQAELEDLSHPEMSQAQAMQAVAEAEQAVATAHMNLYILKSMPPQEAIEIAKASLLFKQREYQDIQKSISRLENQIKSAPSETVRDRLEAQLIRTKITLAKQKIEVDEASYKVAGMGDPPDPDSLSLAEVKLSSAQAELAQAQQDLKLAQTSPSPAALAEAQARAGEALATWGQRKNGPDPVRLAEANTRLAEAQARLALVQQAELVLELRAPFDGTVLAVSAGAGDRVQNAPVITLTDLSQPMIQMNVDETDLTAVQTGLGAQVVFDALPDDSFSGQVLQIDPSLQSYGNSEAARVLVRLDQPDPRAAASLPLGLNASVDILIGQASNAVLVPVDAIRQLENGDTVAVVIADNQLEQRPVTVGLMDLTSAEVTSGLQAGEIVALGALDLTEGALR